MTGWVDPGVDDLRPALMRAVVCGVVEEVDEAGEMHRLVVVQMCQLSDTPLQRVVGRCLELLDGQSKAGT